MILKNSSQKTILSDECKIVSSFVDSQIGLLNKNYHSIVLNTRFGIHTWGLSKAIDVMVLNSTGKVVKIKESLLPNRIFLWNPIFDQIIELPKGSIKRSKTKIGDQITKSPSAFTEGPHS